MHGHSGLQQTGATATPLDSAGFERVAAAVDGLDSQQLQWLSGYVAGLAAARDTPPRAVAEAPRALTVLYGSQTGNGESVARQLAEQARADGFAVTLASLADYKPGSLKRESLLSLVISTHGEGDPPDDAELFHEFLMSAKAPRLAELRYTVLALGDSSYINFCETGRELDRRLEELGGQRILPMVECDLDYDADADRWSAALIAKLPELLDAGKAVPQLRAVSNAAAFGRQNPFPAEVLVNQKITGGGSGKDVRHIELSLEGSGLDYEPGDALAVVVENPPQLVTDLIAAIGADPASPVQLAGRENTLGKALSSELEITALNLKTLQAWAGYAGSGQLAGLLGDSDSQKLAEFLDRHQLVDLIRGYPATVSPQQFVDLLRKLSPRSYSIASSPRANPGEVHLTVAAVRYEAFGSVHFGAASTHLADRLDVGDTVPVYIEPNSRFRLPDDDSSPLIMIGPGTGVAPFRAFVEERAEREAAGGHWLFFGDRTFADDFLYQLEWQRHLKHGRLDRLDVAFSRDQQQKVYVQDRLREHSAEFYRWIEAGAFIYVCGDAKQMAGDVHETIIDVLAEQGSVDRPAAEQRLRDLRRAGRYQRDVY